MPVAACEDPEAVVLPLWRTVVEAVCVDPEEELRAVDPEAVEVEPEERTGVPALAEPELERLVAVEPEERAVPEVVRTVVRPLLVTFELETVVSLRSTLARPDWEEPVVVVLAPEEAALMLVEEERVEEEELRAVFCAWMGAATRKRQAARAEILLIVFISKCLNHKFSAKYEIFPNSLTFSFYICML